MKKTDTDSTSYIIDSKWLDTYTEEELTVTGGINNKFIGVVYSDKSVDILSIAYCDKHLIPSTTASKVLYEDKTGNGFHKSFRQGKQTLRENLSKEFLGTQTNEHTIESIKTRISDTLSPITSDVKVELNKQTKEIDVQFTVKVQPPIEFIAHIDMDLKLDDKKPDED